MLKTIDEDEVGLVFGPVGALKTLDEDEVDMVFDPTGMLKTLGDVDVLNRMEPVSSNTNLVARKDHVGRNPHILAVHRAE